GAYTPVRCAVCTYIGYIVNSRVLVECSHEHSYATLLSMVQNSHYVRGSSLTPRETNKSRKRGTHAGRTRAANLSKFCSALEPLYELSDRGLENKKSDGVMKFGGSMRVLHFLKHR
ncbi:unnamed protein product, partial [Trichogramma brassicae]